MSRINNIPMDETLVQMNKVYILKENLQSKRNKQMGVVICSQKGSLIILRYMLVKFKKYLVILILVPVAILCLNLERLFLILCLINFIMTIGSLVYIYKLFLKKYDNTKCGKSRVYIQNVVGCLTRG